MKTKTAFVISTTHWDREWYWPQEQFRIRLVELIDELIKIFDEVPRYRYYTLDGQTIPIEDYLEIKPEQKQKLVLLIKEGRLIPGPWYILPDVFLISNESLLRNLLIGCKIANEYGGVLDVGYLPDSFSHIDQMPQILIGFNFKEFLFMRGMGNIYEKLGTEFWWEAPDGSRVFATYLIQGYFNAGGLGFKDAFIDFRNMKPDFELAYSKMKDVIKKYDEVYKSDVYLLFNGSDHTTPQRELPEILDYLNEKFPDIYFKHSTIRDYLYDRQPSEELPVYKGELTGNIHHLNVRSVYSTRIYLKQNNFQCQSLLEKYVEPISAISFIEGLNDFKPNIDYSWKTLLKNHPHDSITGCSIDEVHRDMMNRFNRIQQIGKYIEEKSISAISNEINTEVHEGEPIVVYNPLNWQRQEVIRGKILFPDSSLVYKIKQEKNNISFNLLNFIGETVPFQIINKYEKNIIELNNWRKFLIYEIEFVASVPPMGYSIFYFQETNVNPSKSKIKISKNSIENEFYKITVNKNGSLRILNKLTKESFNNFNMFEDTEDDGDEYTYSFVENSKTFTTSDSVSRVDLFEKNLLSGTLRVEINFRLPESLDESRTKRSKKITNNKIVSYITLYSNVNRVDIKTEVDNNSKDHRLRILFPTKFKDYRNYADGHFDVVERVKYFPDKPKERGKIEYYSTQHQSNFVTLTNGKTGITIANKGLPEYEIKKEESAIALTLLRSMGWLNKNNLMTRWRMAGPDIETPDAQCQGKNVFEYSIIIHKDSWENAYKEAYNFVYSLYSISIKRNFGTLPGSLSFITLKPDDLIISALKITEKKDGLLLRFYNIKSYDVPGEIIIYKDFKKCFLTDFLENELSELKIVDNRVKISVSRNKIINLKLIFN